MDPDEVIIIKLGALLAATIVNAGTGKAPDLVLADAAQYETSITSAVEAADAAAGG